MFFQKLPGFLLDIFTNAEKETFYRLSPAIS